MKEKDLALLLSAALANRIRHPNAKWPDVCLKAFANIEELVIKHGMVQRTLPPTRCHLDRVLYEFAKNLVPPEGKEGDEDSESKSAESLDTSSSDNTMPSV